jgi:hypothetical protein
MKLKSIILVLLLAAFTDSCQQETLEEVNDGEIGNITAVIGEKPQFGGIASTRTSYESTGEWIQGDAVSVVYTFTNVDGTTTNVSQTITRNTSGSWNASENVYIPYTATAVSATMAYIGTTDALTSIKEKITGSMAAQDISNPSKNILLPVNSMTRQNALLRVTGLAAGTVVKIGDYITYTATDTTDLNCFITVGTTYAVTITPNNMEAKSYTIAQPENGKCYVINL